MNKRNILVLCDFEESYCFRLEEFLRRSIQLPFQIYDITSSKGMESFGKELKKQTAALVISESAYQKMGSCGFDRVLVLEELSPEENGHSPIEEEEDVYLKKTNKYQSMNGIVNAILSFCLAHPDTLRTSQEGEGRLTIYGVYSPVKRCGQTTFAGNLGEVLGTKGKTLYLNLESFAGDTMKMDTEQSEGNNLQDLLYYYESDPSRLPLYLERVVRQSGHLYRIPPAESFLTLKGVDGEVWERLLNGIRNTQQYQYLVIDLSEITDGFLELLSMCERIYTIRISEPAQMAKLAQYEKTMRLAGYSKILEKTTVFEFPYSVINAGEAACQRYISALLSSERGQKHADGN